MYDWQDYLVAIVSTILIVFPTAIMMWRIFRATFPKRVVRVLSPTKRRHKHVGDTVNNSDILAYRATCIAAGVRPTIYGLARAQEEATK